MYSNYCVYHDLKCASHLERKLRGPWKAPTTLGTATELFEEEGRAKYIHSNGRSCNCNTGYLPKHLHDYVELDDTHCSVNPIQVLRIATSDIAKPSLLKQAQRRRIQKLRSDLQTMPLIAGLGEGTVNIKCAAYGCLRVLPGPWCKFRKWGVDSRKSLEFEFKNVGLERTWG